MPHALTTEDFKSKVFDYDNETAWKFLGDKPAIIDFWAEWCAPCRVFGKTFEKVAQQYDGTVDFYKIDTEAEQELAQAFGIRSIPSILFIPMDGKPSMASGAFPEELLVEAINTELLGLGKVDDGDSAV